MSSSTSTENEQFEHINGHNEQQHNEVEQHSRLDQAKELMGKTKEEAARLAEITKEQASKLAEKAREEASRLAAEAKVTTGRIYGGLSNKISEVQREGLNLNMPIHTLIHQLRGAHLITMGLQLSVLYLEANNIGLFFFSFPFMLLLLNMYVVGTRFYHRTDSRYDFNGFIRAQSLSLKTKYAIGLFGGFVLALLVNMLSPSMHTYLGAFFYTLSTYISILIGAGSAGLEIYDGTQHMER